MRRWTPVLFLLLFLPARACFSQGIPVFDAANALQNTIQAVQTVEMVLNQVLELAGLEEIVLGADIGTEMEQLGEILTEAKGLGQDINTIQLNLTLLFDLDNAPASTRELQERLQQIRRITYQVYVDAIRTETLLQSTVSALRHMVRLTEAISEFLGNKQGNQTLAQWDAKLTIELIKLRTHTAAFQRAQAVDRLAEPITIQSIIIITDAQNADHPR